MKKIIIVALLGLLSFSVGAQCRSYGRGYGYYGRLHMRHRRHYMAEGYGYGYGRQFRGGGYERQYRRGDGQGWNGNRGNSQYGNNNQNSYNNNQNGYNGGQGGGYNNQYNGQGGGRGGFRRQ